MKRNRPQASAKAFISAFAAKKAKQTPENVPIVVDNPLATATPTTPTAARTQNPKGDLVGKKTAIAPKHVETETVTETVIQKGDDEYEIQYASASDSDIDEEDYEILISDSEEERQPNLIAKVSDVIDLDETSVQVSTFAPTGENLLETDSTSLFCFSHGQRLVIKGQYSVRVIKGSISICSAKLIASTEFHKVFAPSTHPIPTIIADGKGKDIPNDTVRKELMEFIPFDFTPTVNSFLQFDVIIAIRSLFTGMENIEKICQNLKNVWTSPDGQNTRSYEVLYRVPQPPPVLVTPEEGWETRLRIISQRIRDSTTSDVMKSRSEDFRPRILICGPKSAGKSTFARLLTNSLITSAGLAPDEIPNRSTDLAYLELDPGQPEFGPSGVLSLNVIDFPMLGPSLTNTTLSNSVKAFHFGYTTPRDAPQDYIRYVDKLMSHYNNDLHRFANDNACQIELPLIVNTPGWTKGQGVEVLRQMIDIIKPSIIVYIGPRLAQPDMDTNFELAEVLRTTSPNASLTELAPCGVSERKSAKYSAADLRVAQTMAYFHSTGGQTWDFRKPLTAWRPYIVRYSNGGDADVCGIEILGYEKILDQHIPAAINGTVVGISAIAADAALKIRSASTGDSSLPIIDTPTIDADADAINCLGLGIIRAIDQATKTLHILTPISPQTIFHAVSSSNKIIFSRGRLPLPIWAAWDGDQSGVARRPWREVPYLSVDEIIGADVRAAVGGQSLRFRRNVMRRSQHVRT
ncbi:uncharacterized protein V1513DRAFT_172725 [Lipomyces chichibuensis]|uniref:uncharacterized protein n=1 Tax=Lipomyces chichibuensis TaxID=1546026 RepID=UPI0033432A27